MEKFESPNNSIESEPTPLVLSGPVIIQDGKILLVKTYKEKDGERTPSEVWLIPGGKVEEGENLEETCTREAQEELGVGVTLGAQAETITVQRPDGKGMAILHHFFATLNNDLSELPSGTHSAEWFDLNELPDNVAPNIKELAKTL